MRLRGKRGAGYDYGAGAAGQTGDGDGDRELAEGDSGRVRAAGGRFAAAFFFDIPRVGSQLHVLTGERQHLMVSVCGFGEPAEAAVAAERIARKAIRRL